VRAVAGWADAWASKVPCHDTAADESARMTTA
jgi:hypothetical protein